MTGLGSGFYINIFFKLVLHKLRFSKIFKQNVSQQCGCLLIFMLTENLNLPQAAARGAMEDLVKFMRYLSKEITV